MQLQQNSMIFDSKTTSTKKQFIVKFPVDIMLTLEWGKKELKKLQKYDASDLVSDKLEMVAMIARKIEEGGVESYE